VLGRYVRVIELGESFRFGAEPPRRSGSFLTASEEDLEDRLPLEFGIPGKVHLSHAPWVEDVVVCEGFAWDHEFIFQL
jgi:hypothetical protein